MEIDECILREITDHFEWLPARRFGRTQTGWSFMRLMLVDVGVVMMGDRIVVICAKQSEVNESGHHHRFIDLHTSSDPIIETRRAILHVLMDMHKEYGHMTVAQYSR
jgi:hypothetical protein